MKRRIGAVDGTVRSIRAARIDVDGTRFGLAATRVGRRRHCASRVTPRASLRVAATHVTFTNVAACSFVVDSDFEVLRCRSVERYKMGAPQASVDPLVHLRQRKAFACVSVVEDATARL
jgi:hypothetical protein